MKKDLVGDAAEKESLTTQSTSSPTTTIASPSPSTRSASSSSSASASGSATSSPVPVKAQISHEILTQSTTQRQPSAALSEFATPTTSPTLQHLLPRERPSNTGNSRSPVSNTPCGSPSIDHLLPSKRTPSQNSASQIGSPVLHPLLSAMSPVGSPNSPAAGAGLPLPPSTSIRNPLSPSMGFLPEPPSPTSRDVDQFYKNPEAASFDIMAGLGLSATSPVASDDEPVGAGDADFAMPVMSTSGEEQQQD